jgi:integrase
MTGTTETQGIVVLSKQDLTKSAESVKKLDIRKYWDRDYINQHIAAIQDHKHRMLFTFLWYSGVRITEALSLTKMDIDFPNHVMTLKWLKSRKYNYRNAPIHPHLNGMLEVYAATMRREARLFPISRQRAWQLCRKYLNGHPHQIRHSFAVNWLRCGGDIVTLHRIMGHSKLQTTMEYLKIVPIDQGKELIKVTFT